jgi:hypothetical protein
MAAQPIDKCSPATVNVGGSSAGSLNPKQTAYAQAIINQVAAKGMPENAAIIAIATAMQESTLLMYWNAQVPGSQELADGGPEGGRYVPGGTAPGPRLAEPAADRRGADRPAVRFPVRVRRR